jgi:peptidoglycan/LPS O-acetylase OafA/YrhL
MIPNQHDPVLNRGKPLRGIQALRALAAMAVVLYHAADLARARLVPGAPAFGLNGAAGVDLFFVISGFVMVVSARRLSVQADAARMFLGARLRRIVPLYWACTALKIAAVLAFPAAAHTTRLGLAYCIDSFLFLPVHDMAGQFRPVLPVGWTLSFEMLFYALFAACLAARQSPALLLPPVLAAIALLPQGSSAWHEISNPIVLEFAFGTTLATLWLRGYRLPAPLAWLVLATSLAWLVAAPKTLLATRLLSWGLPAGALLGATVSLEQRIAARIPREILALGDASYAIYLSHGFVLAALGYFASRMPGLAPALGLATGVLASAAFGCLMYRMIEWPLLRSGAAVAPAAPPAVVVLAGGGFAPLSGGVGTLMRNLVEAWAQTPGAPRIRMIDTRGSGGRIAAVPYFVKSFCILGWLAATRRTSLVHAHMTTRGSALRKALLALLAMALGVKVILHMHGADFFEFYRSLPPLLRGPFALVLRRAHHVVLGEAWRRFLIQEVGVAPSRISIVPNGVPMPRTTPMPTAALPPSSPAHILFLGRLCARKGLPDLISAFGLPAMRGLAWHATIAGDGNPAPYRAMLGWFGLENRVCLPGWTGREETACLLAQADILVLPSYHEALPIAVLEALAAGVAVIATPVGAIPEFLQDGVNALLVPPGSPALLAEAMGRLLEDPGLRKRLARAGHDLFRHQFEIGGVAARMAEIYRAASHPARPVTLDAQCLRTP